jgi:hypothetical protein
MISSDICGLSNVCEDLVRRARKMTSEPNVISRVVTVDELYDELECAIQRVAVKNDVNPAKILAFIIDSISAKPFN